MQLIIFVAAVLAVCGWIVSSLKTRRALRRVKELLSEVESLKNEAVKLDSSKSEFIAMAAHQLKAPLAVIRDYAQSFMDGALGPSGALARQSMGKVLGASERLIRVIGDFFELARRERGDADRAGELVALEWIIAETVGSFEPVARAKGINIYFSDRSAERRATNADPEALRVAVRHLIDNAIRYTSAGRVQVELFPEIRGSRGWLRLNISDTGIGVGPADTGLLFTKFSRTEEARRIWPEGLGLGLYTAKLIADDHGGEVGMRSAGLGHGSDFWMRVPSTL